MCGKFTQKMAWAELAELAGLTNTASDAPDETVTPMRFASVIALAPNGMRKAVRMRWGLVPPGARDPGAVKPHIHARAETIDVKPTFRDAFVRRRGLVAVTTFNEGREITPTKTEQFVLTPQDGRPVAIAVIWERWQNPDGPSLLSFAMVTVPPNALIASITDRMPALLGEDDWATWLGETPADPAALKALLQPSPRPLLMRPAKPPPARKNPAQPDLL